jgi:hypothetical protein
LPIERFIALLHTYGIERLADIRTAPRSRHNPQLNGDALDPALKREHILGGRLNALRERGGELQVPTYGVAAASCAPRRRRRRNEF